jgi:hypothetical protein
MRRSLNEETTFLAAKLRCTKMDINDARQMVGRNRAAIAKYIMANKILRALQRLTKVRR